MDRLFGGKQFRAPRNHHELLYVMPDIREGADIRDKGSCNVRAFIGEQYLPFLRLPNSVQDLIQEVGIALQAVTWKCSHCLIQGSRVQSVLIALPFPVSLAIDIRVSVLGS